MTRHPQQSNGEGAFHESECRAPLSTGVSSAPSSRSVAAPTAARAAASGMLDGQRFWASRRSLPVARRRQELQGPFALNVVGSDESGHHVIAHDEERAYAGAHHLAQRIVDGAVFGDGYPGSVLKRGEAP
jgi:hypothetical protein